MIFFTQQKRSKFQKYALLAHESPKLVGLRASSASPIPPPHLLSQSCLLLSKATGESAPRGATKPASFPSPSWVQFPAQLLSLHPSQKSSFLPSSPSDAGHRCAISETEETTHANASSGWHLLNRKRRHAYFNRNQFGSQNRHSDGKDTLRGLLSLLLSAPENVCKAVLVLYLNTSPPRPHPPATSSEKVLAYLRLHN